MTAGGAASTGRSSSSGASELMRSLGLLVDGPAVWGAPVAGRGPGVFVVELPTGADDVPIDSAAVRRWLERVPGMLVDGQPATLQSVAARLRAFWLPAEPVLFVGRSARSVGARVAALYATPLGDPRPYSAGNWLKTLSVLPRLRVWWAGTDAYEEYEDALISAVAERTAAAVVSRLPDQETILPFANLVSPTGAAKRHGIERALREPAPEGGVGAGRDPGTRRATAHGAAAGPTAARPPVMPGRPQVRRARRPADAAPRRVPEPAYLSADGLAQLQRELDELRTVVRPGVIGRVKAARELGDLRENAEYESARNEQSFVEGRIQALEARIRSIVVVDSPAQAGVAVIGSTVVVEANGEELVFVLVGSTEADPAAGRISYSSPVGQALLGRRAGDETLARLPGGEVRYRVLAVR